MNISYNKYLKYKKKNVGLNGSGKLDLLMKGISAIQQIGIQTVKKSVVLLKKIKSEIINEKTTIIDVLGSNGNDTYDDLINTIDDLISVLSVKSLSDITEKKKEIKNLVNKINKILQSIPIKKIPKQHQKKIILIKENFSNFNSLIQIILKDDDDDDNNNIKEEKQINNKKLSPKKLSPKKLSPKKHLKNKN
jgi:hypothetical protein